MGSVNGLVETSGQLKQIYCPCSLSVTDSVSVRYDAVLDIGTIAVLIYSSCLKTRQSIRLWICHYRMIREALCRLSKNLVVSATDCALSSL